MSASSFTITPGAGEADRFQRRLLHGHQSVMVKTGSDIQGIDDLAGPAIGAQRGTTGADLARPSRGPRSSATTSSTTPSTRWRRPTGWTRSSTTTRSRRTRPSDADDFKVAAEEPERRELRPGLPQGQPRPAGRLQRRPRGDQGERDLRRDLQPVVRRGPAGPRRGPARRLTAAEGRGPRGRGHPVSTSTGTRRAPTWAIWRGASGSRSRSPCSRSSSPSPWAWRPARAGGPRRAAMRRSCGARDRLHQLLPRRARRCWC